MLSSRTTHRLAQARALSLLQTDSLTLQHRRYRASAITRKQHKNNQDRESLKPRSSDSTQSATDDDVAAHKDAAFNPRKTGPAEEKAAAGKGGKENPLEASGANQELSKPQGDNPGGEAARPTDKKRKSGGSSGKKHGKI